MEKGIDIILVKAFQNAFFCSDRKWIICHVSLPSTFSKIHKDVLKHTDTCINLKLLLNLILFCILQHRAVSSCYQSTTETMVMTPKKSLSFFLSTPVFLHCHLPWPILSSHLLSAASVLLLFFLFLSSLPLFGYVSHLPHISLWVVTDACCSILTSDIRF